MTSFRDEYVELQFLIKEMKWLRDFNTKQAKLGLLNDMLLFSEANTMCVAFERFLRILPAMRAGRKETLSNFIERALSKKKPLFKSPYVFLPQEEWDKYQLLM